MRVLLKKDFTIDFLSVDKVINVNDTMVSRLEVEVEENLLIPGERLWVVFSKTKDTPTDDITKEIQLGTDNKTYSVAIPQGVVKQEGTWYFILSARKYYSEDKYFTRKATAPYEFTVAGGLWIDENTGEEVNIGTVQSLYEMAVDKIKLETTNAEDIKKLQTAIGAEADGETEATGIYAKIDAEASARQEADAQKASVISVAMDNTTYQASFRLYANEADAEPIYETTVDLPLENVVVGGYYDDTIKKIKLKLLGGGEVEFSVADLVNGLISSSEKGAPNGVASLDKTGKVPKTQLPDDIGSGGVSEEEVKEAVKETLTNSTETWTNNEKAAACDKIGAANEADIDEALDEIIEIQEALIKKGGAVVSGAENIEDGEGNGAVQQVADGVENGFDFTGKNPNAEALDDTLSAIQPYGATGDFAVALGGKSSAQGKRSTTEGTTTIAKGKYSHAEGDNSVTLGDDSHAEGYQTVAGEKSDGMHIAQHAEGIRTQALGWAAHSEGSDTIAKGNNSHAGGSHTIAEWNDQTAIGRYNYNKYGNLFEVGNGYVDENGQEVRRNAFEVDEYGIAYAGGKRLLKEGEAGGDFYENYIVITSRDETDGYKVPDDIEFIFVAGTYTSDITSPNVYDPVNKRLTAMGSQHVAVRRGGNYNTSPLRLDFTADGYLKPSSVGPTNYTIYVKLIKIDTRGLI